MVSKNPISCLVKASNSITLILHVQELITHSKRPPLQPALTELINQRENLLDVTCEEQTEDKCGGKTLLASYLPRE